MTIRIGRPKRTKIEVPIDPEVLKKLIERAHSMGFGSAQAYIRFWAAAEVTAEHPLLAQQNLNTINGQILRYIELILAFQPADFINLDAGIRFLFAELRKSQSKKMMHEIIKAQRNRVA